MASGVTAGSKSWSPGSARSRGHAWTLWTARSPQSPQASAAIASRFVPVTLPSERPYDRAKTDSRSKSAARYALFRKFERKKAFAGEGQPEIGPAASQFRLDGAFRAGLAGDEEEGRHEGARG